VHHGKSIAPTARNSIPAPDITRRRTDQEHFGKIFRRNIAYGTLTRPGTIFVGLSRDQSAAVDAVARIRDAIATTEGIDGVPLVMAVALPGLRGNSRLPSHSPDWKNAARFVTSAPGTN
jgi:hypothetical protein